METYRPHQPIAYMEVVVTNLRLTCPVCHEENYFPEAVAVPLEFDPDNPQYRKFYLKKLALVDGNYCQCLIGGLSNNPYVTLFAEAAVNN